MLILDAGSGYLDVSATRRRLNTQNTEGAGSSTALTLFLKECTYGKLKVKY